MANIQTSALMGSCQKPGFSLIPDTRNTQWFWKLIGYGSGIEKYFGFGSGIGYPSIFLSRLICILFLQESSISRAAVKAHGPMPLLPKGESTNSSERCYYHDKTIGCLATDCHLADKAGKVRLLVKVAKFVQRSRPPFPRSGLSVSVIKQYLQGIHWHGATPTPLMLSTLSLHFSL